MGKNLRRLQLIFRLTRLTPDMFYVITIWSDEIILQGYKNDLVNVCDKLKFYDSGEGSVECPKFIRKNTNIKIIHG